MDGNNHQLDTSMVQYENLPSPDLNQGLLNQIDANIKGTHWSATYQCITMIRGICKAYPQHIPDIFVKYGMVLLDLFNNGATQNIKNILKLLREVFLQGQTLNIETLVGAFLPLVVKKAAIESGQIKQACQELMTVISSNCGYPKVIQVSTELSCEKNLAISEMSIKLLSVIIMNIGNALTQINPGTLQILMKGMSILINGKRNNMKTSALDVCVFIYNQIGSENFLQLLNYSLPQEEVMLVGQAMEQHRVQKQKAPHFADVLKQHKQQQGMMRQSGQWNNQNNIR